MKLFTGLTAAALVAVMAQGCGGEDVVEDNVGGSGGGGGSTAGTGGGDSGGGDGGTSDGGGTTGGEGGGTTGGEGGGGSEGIPCGESTCGDYADALLVSFTGGPLLACCPTDPKGGPDACGLDVTPAKDVLGIEGCMELDQPGTEHANCIELDTVLSVDGVGDLPITLPGCCMPNAQCGVEVDLEAASGILGPGADFGCTDPTPFMDGLDPIPEGWENGAASCE